MNHGGSQPGRYSKPFCPGPQDGFSFKNNGQRQSVSRMDRQAVSPIKSNSSSASHILRIHPASGLIFRFFPETGLFQASCTHEPGGREKSPDSRRENRACDGAGEHSGGLLLSRPSVPCRIRGGGRPESGVHRGEVKINADALPSGFFTAADTQDNGNGGVPDRSKTQDFF